MGKLHIIPTYVAPSWPPQITTPTAHTKHQSTPMTTRQHPLAFSLTPKLLCASGTIQQRPRQIVTTPRSPIPPPTPTDTPKLHQLLPALLHVDIPSSSLRTDGRINVVHRAGVGAGRPTAQQDGSVGCGAGHSKIRQFCLMWRQPEHDRVGTGLPSRHECSREFKVLLFAHLHTPRRNILDRRPSSPCIRTPQLRTRHWRRHYHSRPRNSIRRD